MTGKFDEPVCRSGTVCVALPGELRRCQVLAKLGEDCTTNPCEPTTTCKAGICAPGSALGEPCEFKEPQGCAAGSACSEGQFVCMPMLAEGEECDSVATKRCAGSCVSTAGSPQVCVIPKGEGGACEFAQFHCLDGLDCVKDVCTARTKPKSC